MRIFDQEPLDPILRSLKQDLKQYLDGRTLAQLQAADDDTLAQGAVQTNTVAPLRIHWEQMMPTSREVDNPGAQRPFEATRVQIITFHFPYEGNENVFKYQPKNRIAWTHDVRLDPRTHKMSFDVTDKEQNTDEVRRLYSGIVDNMQRNHASVSSEIAAFHTGQIADALAYLPVRREELQRQAKVLRDLAKF